MTLYKQSSEQPSSGLADPFTQSEAMYPDLRGANRRIITSPKQATAVNFGSVTIWYRDMLEWRKIGVPARVSASVFQCATRSMNQVPSTSTSILVRKKQSNASSGRQTTGSFSLNDVFSTMGIEVR